MMLALNYLKYVSKIFIDIKDKMLSLWMIILIMQDRIMLKVFI